MGSNYWRVEFIQPATPGSDRCVMLRGQLDEIVGPLSIEMAEAWIDHFENRAAQTKRAAAVDPAGTIVPRRNLALPRTEPAN